MNKYNHTPGHVFHMEGINDQFRTYISSLEEELRESGEYMEPGWFNFFVEPKLLLEVKDKTRGKEERQELTLDDILKRKDNVIITGEPGIGKSSFLRWAGIYLCQHHESLELLPVHVHLINYAGSLIDNFQDAIQRCDPALMDPNYVDYRQLLIKLKDGRVVFLFDALDEAGELEQVSKQIKGLKASPEYGNNQIIVSIRTNIYAPHLLGDFVELKMQPFTEEQVKKYLKKKLGHQSKMVYDRLHGDAQLMDLCKLPLMLRFITEIRGELEGITNKAKLYERFIDQRFLTREEWEKGRGSYGHTKIDILAELAYFMQTDKSVIAEYGGRRINAFSGDDLLLSRAGKHKSVPPDEVRKVVDEIKANGLLIKEGRELTTYRFLHLTIQEYLAARAIKLRVTDEEVPFSSGVEKMSIKEFMDRHVRYEDKTFS